MGTGAYLCLDTLRQRVGHAFAERARGDFARAIGDLQRHLDALAYPDD